MFDRVRLAVLVEEFEKMRSGRKGILISERQRYERFGCKKAFWLQVRVRKAAAGVFQAERRDGAAPATNHSQCRPESFRPRWISHAQFSRSGWQRQS